MKLLPILILLWACEVGAATYYVRLDGNDGNNGTATNTAWLTIGHATATAVAGDTVNVGVGEFNEFVTAQNNGTAGNPIVFTGTRGGDGSWQTVINPSTHYNSWTAAPEIGTGVYKITGLTNPIVELTIGATNQRVLRIYSSGDVSAWIGCSYSSTTPSFTTGAGMLLMPSNATAVDYYSGATINFWDDLGALYANTNTGPSWTCYLRLRDGSDPSSKNVRGTMGPNTLVGGIAQLNYGWGTALALGYTSYNTWKNFHVLGGYGGILLAGSTTYGNLIQSNYIDGCSGPLTVYYGARDNVIQGNELFGNFLGWTNMGAWSSGLTAYPNGYRANCYTVQKCFMGQGSACAQGIYVQQAGNSNTICWNYVHNSFGDGLSVDNQSDSTTPTYGTMVYSNTAANHSEVGLFFGPCQVATLAHHNTIADNGSNIRVQNMDWNGETNRLVYVYRNTFWEPTTGGSYHIYAHFVNSSGPSETNVNVWIYHNSFTGSDNWLEPSGYVVAHGGLPSWRFVNNIISDVPDFAMWNSGYMSGWYNSGMVGACDYNKTPILDTASIAWYAANNIKTSTPTWDTPNTAGMSFALSPGDSAINAALDITQSFTLQGSNYSALPNGPETKTGAAWDMGSLEFSSGGGPSNVTVTIGTMNVGTGIFR